MRVFKPMRGAEEVSATLPQGGEQGGPGPLRWRRYLTTNNGLLLLMVAVLVLVLLQRHGILLPSPSVDVGGPATRGKVAPNFELPSLQGPPVRLSQFRGQVALVNFWATWCPPCRAEMPSIERLHRAYASRGLVILAVDDERVGRAVVEGFQRDLGLTFPILLDSSGDVSALYGVRGLPTTVLVDREGRIASVDFGTRDWSDRAARGLIEKLLAEKEAAK